MRKILSIFAAALFALCANAAVINITNETPDALRLALNNAANGDEIVMAAGTYVESNENYIAFAGKHVTVKAAEGAEVLIQPKVSVQVTEGGCAHFVNVKFDASHLNDLADWYEHLIYPADANANNSIILDGCELYGFNLNKSMLYCSGSNVLGAITINNCQIHNCMKSVLFVENTSAAINAQVTNSTFADIATNTESYWAGIIDIRNANANLLVDHCTFYNVIPMNTDYSCVSKITLANGAASNCIFMLPTAQDGIRAMRGVTATNCITFNYLKDGGTGIHSSVTQNNCVQVDPLFVNAAEGNFTLAENSPALTMNDGQPIGDPRWVPSVAPVEPLMKTIYCKMAQDWWKADGAAVGIYAYGTVGEVAAWPGVRMEAVEGETDLWKADIDVANYPTVIFVRVNGTGDIADWGAKSEDLAVPADKDLYTITSTEAKWAGVGQTVEGEWSVYTPAAPQPVEMTAIYDWAGEIGTTILGTTGVEISTVKIHTNTDAVPAIKFGSSYVYADGKYIAIKPAEGGFQAGDVLSVAAVFNNADDTKYAQIDLRAADGDTRIWLSDSASTINGRTQAGEPIVQTYTLAADQDSLFLGRYGNTGMFIILLKVERAGGETPVEPETIPTTAPAVPAQAEADVMAIYCNHYTTNNANFGISGWAGGYQTLDLNGTMAAYWTGMTWECVIDPVNTDAAHDYSAYENIHVDMWAPAAAKIKFTAEAVAGGNYKDGQVLDLVQGWNSFDIAIADWAGNYDFANLKCFALEQYQTPEGASFEGNPFAIANIYFWNAPVAIDTYTVAGSSAIAFGTTWDPANVANDMALQEDGTYKWEKENLELAEGEIAFKVCENHAWTHAWPAQDYKLAIPEAGLYTVTITFNPAAEADHVAALATKTGEAVVLPTIILHGNFTGNWADTDPFVAAADKLTASLTLNLAEGTYEFGFKFDGTWKANGANITRDANTANLATGDGNMHITADKEGEYLFVYTFATQEVVVTYPSLGPEPLTIPTEAPVPTAAEEDVMAIFCNHYPNNNANFGISGWAGGYQILDLNGINVGYWTGMTWECIIDPAHTDDAHDFSAYKNIHVDLWAPLPAKIKFTAEAVNGGNYKDGMVVEMQQGWNNVDFVVAEWAGNYDFKNLKCFVFEQYQTLEGESFEGNPFAFANIYFYGKEEQGVENVNDVVKAVKMIENGQVIIIKNGVKYNVMGARVR